MKISKKLLAVALVACGFSTVSFAQTNPTIGATATATATIVATLTITNSGNMNFGNLGVNGNPGTVVLSTAAGRTTGGGGGVSLVPGGTPTAASFDLVGETGYAYTFSVPTGDVIITNTSVGNAGETMIVNTFTSSASGTLTGGLETVKVGATLNVPASQVPGVYVSATPFTVTVHYN